MVHSCSELASITDVIAPTRVLGIRSFRGRVASLFRTVTPRSSAMECSMHRHSELLNGILKNQKDLYIILCVCMWVHTSMYAVTTWLRSEGKLIPSIYRVHPRDQTKDVRLGSKLSLTTEPSH